MKNTLLVLFCLISTIGFAQNYQCLQYGPRYYFSNNEGYLRGMRIDSVDLTGVNKIYYPFRSIRDIDYISPSGYFNHHVDTLGGSWLGKKVTVLPDGTFLFDNRWNDTTIIKSQGNLGDSWIFFNDTTNVSYKATITALGTMAFAGYYDSVKTITITADSAGTPRTDDPVNNFQIILSKNHGFVQIFDLYTFPYHRPDSFSNIDYIDYYLDMVLGNTRLCDVVPCGSFFPDTSNSIFRMIPLHNPTTMEIYDFAIGDVYEYYNEDVKVETNTTIGTYNIDTITSKTINTYSVTYGTSNHNNVTYYIWPPFMPDTSFSYYSFGVGGFYGDTTFLIDRNTMPEEVGCHFLYRYFPNYYIYDSTGCVSNFGYTLINNMISTSGAYYAWGSDGFVKAIPIVTRTFATGYGQTGIASNLVVGTETISQSYTFVYKNGIACYGTVLPIDKVQDVVHGLFKIQLIPNPANDQFTVKTENYNQSHIITITNTVGQIVGQVNTDKNEELISTTDYAPGLYYVTVTDKSGGRLSQKLAVVH